MRGAAVPLRDRSERAVLLNPRGSVRAIGKRQNHGKFIYAAFGVDRPIAVPILYAAGVFKGTSANNGKTAGCNIHKT